MDCVYGLAALHTIQKTEKEVGGENKMAKRYANMAIAYGIIAMIAGVFYREFTKFHHFSGQTNLSVMHTHYFLLGMFFFLILMLAERICSFSDKNTGKLLIVDRKSVV